MVTMMRMIPNKKKEEMKMMDNQVVERSDQ